MRTPLRVEDLIMQAGELPFEKLPGLQLIYDTAPVGLAFLTPDCRYVQVNQRLTEICGISVADHIGRSVRETVPQVADQVEAIVGTVMRTGQPVTGIEVNGQRTDGRNVEHAWLTSWHPLNGSGGAIVGVSVVAEDITERKRTEAIVAASAAALRESEARFRELADNISQFAWTADATGWRHWFNKRWYDYSGTTFEEMKGFGWRKLHHPDHAERVLRGMDEGFASGAPWEDTFPLRGRDGNYRWFLTRVMPIRDEAGEVIRWFGTNTDVTQQIEAENALRELNATLEERVVAETQERLRIWNVSQDLLMVSDDEGRCLSVNPAWQATLGWSDEELLGKTSQWLLYPDDRERTRAEIARLARGERSLRFENRFRHRDGSYRWLSWKASPDRGRIYAVARDVTELKQVENALDEARQELERVTRQTTLAAMTASIAHEINQPLAAIATNGNAGKRWLAMDPPNLDEVRAALQRIVDDAHRTSEIIAGIRAMFRKENLVRHPLSLNDLVRDVLALVQTQLEQQKIRAYSELQDEIPQIVAERVQLQQVVLNLIMNAIEAMSGVTDRERSLLVRSDRPQRDDVRITIADSGRGIDPNDSGRIFDTFFTTKAQGTGMGLSICKSIVEAHGDRLWVEPNIPNGCCFHVQLPVGGTSQ